MTADDPSNFDFELPTEYIYLKYREKFNLSWQEFIMTPLSVIGSDLEIWQIEGDIEKWKKGVPSDTDDNKDIPSS